MMDFRMANISKQEAYDLLRDWIKLVARHTNPNQDISELLGWLWKLKPPVLDAETGLVPCGCGGKAIFWGHKRKGLLRCDNCGIQTKEITADVDDWFEVLHKQWNTAMGYHPEEGAE